ncbi:acetylornithine deacetylase [Thalassospira sp. HF15]|uniref:acetylornithine deacetylase n=1 Tax=Thalassospira sp. HF15 TaxID=2722755 RepID=UPI0014320DE4|nr:acetylornithine deacetylase [Thalassospira sp. HF15]NIY74828.1 acetylornithine deacetylase [Thalassospira sp. HF15]
MSKPNMSRLHHAIDLLGKLVAFDTTSKNSNLGLIHFVRDYLAEYGIESTLFHDETGEKANLLATIGPKGMPGIALSGHTDVVPALETTWISPAFELTERDGKLFGRGSADMKGFSACVLAMIPELVKRDLTIPFHLCLSYDEEVGCIGVGSMVDHLAAMDTPPRLAVIGEPTDMKVINGQKGKYSMRVAVTGTAGHSSFAPNHVNAIEYASRAINLIAEKARAFEETGPFDDDFTVPHSTMLTTTISGGTATNVTPEYCEFTFEIRHLPDHDAEAVIADLQATIMDTLDAEMKAKADDTGFSFEKIFSYPGMGDCTDAEGFEYVRNVIPEISGKVSYGSEGGVFEKQGNIPSIICGPGSIQQAHKPNEFIEISQIEECLDFLEALTDQAIAA